ncbi:MAG: DUF1570 domain-containing protein [Tepidisphaeraceae bacterium]
MRRLIALFLAAFACFAALSAPARAAGAFESPATLRVLETRHYRIHSDLERAFAEDLGKRMDAMFEDYSRRLADFNPDRRTKFEVYLFAKRQDYLDFTRNKVPNTGGVFMPSRNTLAAFLEGQGRDTLRRTLQHEAFHQFAHSAISTDLSPWLNEGLASVFEEGIFMGRSFSLGQVPPRRVRQLQADIKAKRLVSFKKFMNYSLDDWSVALSGEGTRGATQYNQAWAMCHFLIYAGNPGEPIYRRRLLDLLNRLHAGQKGERAFEEAFSDNLDGFQQRFLEFARTLKPTAEASMIERQEILADLLIALNDRGEKFDSVEELRRAMSLNGYRMSYTKGDVRWQTSTDPDTYFENLDGTPLTSHELYFAPRSHAALSDVVLRAPRQVKLRTRFHQSGRKIEHEVLIDEPAR